MPRSLQLCHLADGDKALPATWTCDVHATCRSKMIKVVRDWISNSVAKLVHENEFCAVAKEFLGECLMMFNVKAPARKRDLLERWFPPASTPQASVRICDIPLIIFFLHMNITLFSHMSALHIEDGHCLRQEVEHQARIFTEKIKQSFLQLKKTKKKRTSDT